MIYRFWIASTAWRGQKLLHLPEICSFGKCVGILLQFLKLLIFRLCVPVFGPKMDRKPSGNYRNYRKARVPGDFFKFLKILNFGPWVPVFGPKINRKPSRQPRETKVVGFGWYLVHLFFQQISGGFFSNFVKSALKNVFKMWLKSVCI